MAPLDYNEDTEFNAALRKHGIIPERDSAGSRSPSPPPAPPSPTLSELDLEDLDIDKDDSVRRDDFERVLEARREREKQAQNKRRFGRIYNISKPEYTKEVTEASAVELPGEPEGWGTGVVCVLYKDECVLLSFHPYLHPFPPFPFLLPSSSSFFPRFRPPSLALFSSPLFLFTRC